MIKEADVNPNGCLNHSFSLMELMNLVLWFRLKHLTDRYVCCVDQTLEIKEIIFYGPRDMQTESFRVRMSKNTTPIPFECVFQEGGCAIQQADLNCKQYENSWYKKK